MLITVGKTVPDTMVGDRIARNSTFLALALLIATLLRYEGMPKVEDMLSYPRPTNRQAERSGKPLSTPRDQVDFRGF